MGPTRSPRGFLVAAGQTVAMLLVACQPPAPGSSVTGALPSLRPALETVAPPSVAPAPDLPSLAPPPSGALPPPDISIDYTTAATDLAGFVAAYRETFGLPAMDAAPIGEAGARLCTYMQRHADGDGTVDLDRAVTEADINEPGYPRQVWILAYGLASTFYCPELVVDMQGATP